ncbi:hypothetical protein [Streptomyces sp. B6B3]|uniref:hypothetical protein n=1 Tax=Streptomyces sp. B6B3 TaxID=3153570 RepID=UPI00325F5000
MPLPPNRPSAGNRLAGLRGPSEPQPYNARKIAALTANPGCSRRAVLDAAGIDKAKLARRLGYPDAYAQSPFALTRAHAFAQLVKANGYAELITLLRAELDAPVEEARVADLTDVEGDQDTAPGIRARQTRTLLRSLIVEKDSRVILDHPLLTLDIGGQTAYLEPDALTHRVGDRFHIVVIKSFSAIDGQADPRKVAEAAKEAAVYVLALRRMFAALGAAPEQVADRFLLVCPKDFGNRPYGRLIDLRQQLDAVTYQIDRLGRAGEHAAALPADATFDLSTDDDQRPHVPTDRLTRTLTSLDYLYRPTCLHFCEISRHCRDAAFAAGQPERLGTSVRDDLPGLDNTTTALRAADSLAEPAADQREVVERLRAAAQLRARHLPEAS